MKRTAVKLASYHPSPSRFQPISCSSPSPPSPHVFHPPGWLQKEMKTNAKSTSLKLKKRWFVLTHNSLDYYKSSERNSSKMGTLVLNSLCSIIQPDERVHRETGEGKRQDGQV